MIGMNQMKKKTITGLIIGLAVGLVIAGLLFWWFSTTIKGYENGTNKKFIKLYTQSVAVLTKDVIQGQPITEDMVTEKVIHKSTVPTDALTKGSVIGQTANYNIAANTPVTANMVTSDGGNTADIREQELNTVLMPSDLNEGDYIDIRIMYPNGTDYIVIAQKPVEKIVGQTMWVRLGEDERLLLNGSIVDSFLRQGSKLYATKYTDPTSQIKTSDIETKASGYISEQIANELDVLKTATTDQATTIVLDLVKKYQGFATALTKTSVNYQPNLELISMMRTNKNILEEATARLSEDARTVMENSLTSYQNKAGDAYNNIITGSKDSVTEQQRQRDEILNPTF